MARASRLLVLSLFAIATLAACGGAATVSTDDVEAQALEQFSQQFPVDSVECDEPLPGEEGATITCVLVSEGQAFEMTVTTTSVDGSNVQFDLELTDEL